jgi:hypothetical protein
MSMTAHPVWFKDMDGEWSQINNVIGIVIASPLIARGTYRDNPPVTPAAGGGAVGGTDGTTSAEASMQITGGVTPTVTQNATSGIEEVHVTVSSPSSIAQDDGYLHEPLRYVFGPEPIIFFRTADAESPVLPDATTFSTDRPAVPALADLASGGHFTVFEGDCFFGWDYKRCGVRNTPPYGQTVYDPSA